MVMEKCHVPHWVDEYAALLAEHTIQGILLTDHAFRIVQANKRAAALLGALNVSNLVGIPLHSGEALQGVQTDVPFVVDTQEGPRSGRYNIATEFGAELAAELEFFPAPVPADTASRGYFVLLTDAEPLVDLERAAFQRERIEAMDNIVAGIAHELNNPMTAIMGYAELLLETEKDPKRKQRIALIAEEADRCGKVIANMLTYTRSYGKTLETASVNEILDEVVRLQSYQLRVDSIRIHSFYDESVPSCQLLSAGLRRLLLNLIHNAHQALLEVPAEKRNLWAMTERHGDAILLQISDSGPGVPKPIRHKIFDPFFTTRPLGEGMGLGLSVAFGVVNDHHGKIWLEPRVGGGATFNVELPIRF